MIGSLLFAVALSTSAGGSPNGWVCRAMVDGVHQSGVSVSFALGPDGSVRSRAVDWTPPLARQARSPPGLSPPEMGVTYGNATAPDRLGRPTDVWVGVSSGPGRAQTHATELTLRLDGRGAWTKSFGPLGPGQTASSAGPIATDSKYGKPINVELLDAIGGASAADTILRDSAGRLYGTARYDLGASNRQCLTNAAWPAAERAALDPTHAGCDPAGNATIFKLMPVPPKIDC